MEAPQSKGRAKGFTNNSQFQTLYRGIKRLSPIPCLVKARDYYVRSMSQCAGRASYGGIAATAPGVAICLQKDTFSTSCYRGEDDFRELVRASSQGTVFSRSGSAEGLVSTGFSRSRSAGGLVLQATRPPSLSSATPVLTVERIDEESPCYFPGSFRKTVNDGDTRFPSRIRSFNSPDSMYVERRIAVVK